MKKKKVKQDRSRRGWDDHVASIPKKKDEYLSVDRERELIAAAQSGSSEAMDELLDAVLRLIYHIASKSCRRHHLDRDDLMSEGCIGFIRSVKKYDGSFDVRLVSYASSWIRSLMGMYIHRNRRIVPIPRSGRIVKVATMLRKAGGCSSRSEIVESVAKSSGFSYEETDSLQAWLACGDSSIDAWRAASDESSIDTVLDLGRALEHLSEREVYILRRRFVDGDILEVVADDLGLSRERIRQIEAKALRKMREVIVRG